MKTRRLISTIALLLAACGAAAAQAAGGTYQFALEDGRTKYVEFDASTQTGGGATGRMFFSDDAPVTYQGTLTASPTRSSPTRASTSAPCSTT
jgi:hypothetical protein